MMFTYFDDTKEVIEWSTLWKLKVGSFMYIKENLEVFDIYVGY